MPTKRETTGPSVRFMSGFKWTRQRSAVAVMLAEGHTQEEVGRAHGVSDRTIRRWMMDPGFSAEVARLSVMIATASRAERLRIAHRAVRQRVKEDHIETDRDVLDWLKFAASETEGIRLGLVDELRRHQAGL